MPISFGDQVTATATILPTGETGEIELALEEFTLDPDETLDLSDEVQVIDETQEESIGDVIISLKQQVELSTTTGETIELTNTDLEQVVIEIPNETIVSANVIWDGKILPPSIVTTTGTISSAFQTPTTAIQVGSPLSVLIFDKAVTIIIEDTTGQIAYKLSGTIEWILIDTCSGTYDSPTDPEANGECSITDGIDTKIVTFHFTQFAEVEESIDETVDEIVEQTTTSSGGSGRTGFGPHGIDKSISGTNQDDSFFFVEPGAQNLYKFPIWFKNVIIWKLQGLINDTEYTEAYQWMIKNAVK